jgi:hypothetical protein
MMEQWSPVEVMIDPLNFGMWSINHLFELSQDIQTMYIYEYNNFIDLI